MADEREQPLYPGIESWENEGGRTVITEEDFILMLEVDHAILGYLERHKDKHECTRSN